MSSRFTRAMIVSAALAAGTIGLTTSAATAAPLGVNTLSPNGSVAVNTQATGFSLTQPGGAACSGIASAGYRWTTYMVSNAVDPTLLTFNGAGPSASAGNFTAPLFDSSGTPVTDRNPQSAPTPGLISGTPTYRFTDLVGNAGLVAGTYKIGYACTLAPAGLIENGKYWETSIVVANVTPTGFTWALAPGYAPKATVLSAPTAGESTFSVANAVALATPAITGYSVTAVPGSGPTLTKSFPAGTTTFTFGAADGVVNGQTYAVTAVATNIISNSPVSNSVNVSPNYGTRPPVTLLSWSAGSAASAGTGVLTWTVPVAGPTAPADAPSGYLIHVVAPVTPSGAPAAPADITVSGGTSTTSPAITLAAGWTYSCTVTPILPSPYSASGSTSATVPCVTNNAQVLIQDITVARPVGALVLTQRCGVSGALDAEAASPGFPALDATTDSNGNAYPFVGGTPGTAPTLGGVNTPWTPTGAADSPNFPEYPYPVDAGQIPNAVYPTHCGIDLGTAKLVTSGARAGQYFWTDGHINQVTVVDTRDTDPGWTVNGTMSDFTTGAGGSLRTFSGNYLGWTPKVTDTSDASLEGYDQLVTGGSQVLPDFTTGLTTGKTLATSAATKGLGIATLDARVKLLIPVDRVNGTYTATLTFTTI